MVINLSKLKSYMYLCAFWCTEQFNINSYWEMLSGYNDGFFVCEGLWNEIKPLYDKLHSFVKKRLFTYYNYSMENLNETDAFPAFMTGKRVFQRKPSTTSNTNPIILLQVLCWVTIGRAWPT